MDLFNNDRIFSLSDISNYVNSNTHDHEIIAFFNHNSLFEKNLLPFRFDALLIILCTDGSAVIEIDLKKYEIKKDTLIILHPKNFLSLVQSDSNLSANIIACSQHVVDDLLPKFSDLLPLLIHFRTDPLMHLSQKQADGLNSFFNFIHQKLSQEHSPFLHQKILCLLQAALFEMMEIQHDNSLRNPFGKSRKEEIMAKFIIAVSENYKFNREVTFYANRLCFTPKHLSSVVKELTGYTAGEWIERYVTLEAKMLLKTTDLSIQEISSRLNFANQSFFGKYFKHQTGQSPSSYRKSHP